MKSAIVKWMAALGLATVAVAQMPPAPVTPLGDDFEPARRWQKASDLTGKRVENASDENLGTLNDIVVDANSGRILYGVLSFGGFLGMGDKLFAVPWSSLDLRSDASEIVLNVDKDRLKNAEGFDKNNWPNFADETWATRTYEYYGQKPYWRDSGRMSGSTSVQRSAVDPRPGEPAENQDTTGPITGITHDTDTPAGTTGSQSGTGTSDSRNDDTRRDSGMTRDTQVASTGGSYRDRWYQKPVAWQKCSDLMGKDVHSSTHEDIGEMEDLVIDPDHGRIMYGVLEYGGKLFAVPWNAVRLSGDSKNFVINVDKEMLKDSLAFSRDRWPNMTDEAWARETHNAYRVQPYWLDRDRD
jgi:sporulation protein YlmC with PRC-barrel domain